MEKMKVECCGKDLFYEQRFTELVAADERFDRAKTVEEVLDFAVLIDALRGNQLSRTNNL